jgi:hypothetical protein
MSRLFYLLLGIVTVMSCKLAPNGTLYVRYDVLFDTTIVNALSDDNSSTPMTLEVDTFYETSAGKYTVTYDLDWLGVVQSGSYEYEIAATDEDSINYIGGIWTRGEDKYYTIHIFADDPWISITEYPY